MKKLLFLLILPLMIASCSSDESPAPTPAAVIPSITGISGGVLRLQTSDEYKDLITENILLDTQVAIPDGTKFRIVSEDLLISTDRINWLKDLLAESLSGKITVSVKPGTLPGLYRINIYPIANEIIKFQPNLTARFFIEVLPGKPTVIENISSEKFEDLAPYNNVKELNESWIISADPNLVNYISVGPIKDAFGNNVSDGRILLSTSEGQVISENPSVIADGYAYFSYRPTANSRELVVSASLTGITGVDLVKNIEMKLAKPNLEILDTGDFSEMFEGETREISLRVRNSGNQAATNLSINITSPFILLPEQSDSCKDRGVLRSQETCLLRVRYTRLADLGQNGFIQVIGQPSSFISSTTSTALVVNNVEPAKLVLSQTLIEFPDTSCGLKSSREIYVENIGSYPATNVNITQPPSTVVGQAPYFKIILPPLGAFTPDPDPNVIIDCGTVIPAGRKCRLIVEFQPQSINPAQPVVGLINADSIPSLALSMSGVAVPGQATGDIPISFFKYNTQTPTSTMFAQNGQRTTVRIGPIADSCGNPVANGTVVSAAVTGGTLSALITSTNNGRAEFTWNSLSKAELLGNQTITVTSNDYSKQATITFQGVNLSLSGNLDLGQVIIQKPKQFTFTARNTGNIKADNIDFTMTDPLVLIDKGTCMNGVLVNQTCSFIVETRPSLTQDYNASIFGSSSTLGINSPSLTNISIKGRSKPVIEFAESKYLFNEGGSSANVTRTITVTNRGPAISYNTVIYAESPYIVAVNNCPSTLQVNQSCTIEVQAPRSSAIGAGYKSVYVDNEVETGASSTSLAYAELRFSTQNYTYKKYYCTGPFQIQAVGINSVLTNLSQSAAVTLSSQTGKVLFYSDATCNSKILSVTIPMGGNTSGNFYIRSIAAEPNILTGVSGNIPGAERPFIFEDIRNDILTFKPAMAIKNTSCILCHSNVKGNIVTNFAFTSTQKELHGVSATGTGDYIEVGGSGWSNMTNGSMAFGTSFIEGKIYVPQLTLATASRDAVRAMTTAYKGSNYNSTAQTSTITTVADFINIVTANRTTSYLNYLAIGTIPNGSFPKDSRVNPSNVSVRELRNVFIGYPAPNKITSFLDTLGTFKYYKWTDDSSYDLTNFELRYNNYYGNIPGTVMDCDGDIFVDGAVYLKDLRINTIDGCRIYATGTVFIEGPDGAVQRDGIVYEGTSPNANVQITSSKGILIGMSVASINSRKGHDAPYYGPMLSSMDADIAKIKNASNVNLLKDAADGGNSRKVDFKHLLLNAPRVDSRYTGDFSGVVITEHSIWSLGKFSYFYDNVFDNIPILPFFTPDVFFMVDDCVTNGIDQAVVKDSITNYRSCFP